MIWNYQPLFFMIIRLYNLYSNFISISSILNIKLEKVAALGIIAGACLASHAALAFYSSARITGFSLFSTSLVGDLSQKLTQNNIY